MGWNLSDKKLIQDFRKRLFGSQRKKWHCIFVVGRGNLRCGDGRLIESIGVRTSMLCYVSPCTQLVNEVFLQ
jgi:hypothetical protein